MLSTGIMINQTLITRGRNTIISCTYATGNGDRTRRKSTQGKQNKRWRRQRVKGINTGGRCCRLIADKKDAWPRQTRKCKVWWVGEENVCGPGPQPPHLPPCLPPSLTQDPTWREPSYRLSSSPSVSDRMIMEHSSELFLIHARCDKGGTSFFFSSPFSFFFHCGQL